MTVLGRVCPGCGAAYGEHTLVSLAECVEGLFVDPDPDEHAEHICDDSCYEPEEFLARLFELPDREPEPVTNLERAERSLRGAWRELGMNGQLIPIPRWRVYEAETVWGPTYERVLGRA